MVKQTNLTSLDQSWFNILAQAVDEGIITVDPVGKITSFNHGAERFTGQVWENVRSKPIDKVLKIFDIEGKLIDRLPPDGSKHRIKIFRQDDRSTNFMATAYPWLSPYNGKDETLIILRDVPEDHLLQNLREKFLDEITQEFLTPLAALNASVELFLDEIDQLSPAQIKELSNAMHISVKELQTLIENLLESINIEAGSFFVRLQPVNLENIINDAVKVVKPILNRRSQVVRIQTKSQFPTVKGDPVRLTHVLVNLLLNASKFGPVNQEICLTVTCNEGGMVCVSVADKGPGVPLRERENLFNRFMHLSTKNGAQGGIGLGLSVVKSIVHEHGGQVGVDSNPSGGSIFWFTLQPEI